MISIVIIIIINPYTCALHVFRIFMSSLGDLNGKLSSGCFFHSKDCFDRLF